MREGAIPAKKWFAISLLSVAKHNFLEQDIIKKYSKTQDIVDRTIKETASLDFDSRKYKIQCLI